VADPGGSSSRALVEGGCCEALTTMADPMLLILLPRPFRLNPIVKKVRAERGDKQSRRRAVQGRGANREQLKTL